jgi:hypothetical protein
MAELLLQRSRAGKISYESIAEERLSLIGFIVTAWPRTRYPLPLLSLDGQPVVQYFSASNTTRVQGIIPSTRDTVNREFEAGSWTGQVDIQGRDPYGWGRVYLGNASPPTYTSGYILHEVVPFDPYKELAFVDRQPDGPVIDEGPFPDEKYLAYDLAPVITRLGRVTLPV